MNLWDNHTLTIINIFNYNILESGDMDTRIRKSFKLLEQEFQLQFITAGTVIIFFILSFTMTRMTNALENDLPGMFIVFYAVCIGLVLPWQLNTRGHIELGYCRYHLSLPVRSWKLSILPMVCRLILVALCLGIEILFYRIYYVESEWRYLTINDMVLYIEISLLIYLVMQAYAWSKESFKNLFQYLGLVLIICLYFIPDCAGKIFALPYYPLIILFLVALAIIGVARMRFGRTFELPGVQDIFALATGWRKAGVKDRSFTGPAAAQMHAEWKRTWYFMPLLTLLFIIVCGIIDLSHNRGMLENVLIYLGMIYFAMTLPVPLFGRLFIDNIGFKSAYVNHLPVASKELAKIKIKCFAYSFSICLGLFFLWSVIRLFLVDKVIIARIYYLNAIILESPGVIVWIAAALVVWAFAMAFFIATADMNHRLLSVVLVTLTVVYYLNQYNIYGIYNSIAKRYYGFPYVYGKLPLYMPLAIMLCLLITIKLGLLYLEKRGIIAKVIYMIAAFVFSVLLVVAANYLVILTIIPAVLVFIYPFLAKYRQIIKERHEFGRDYICLPRRMIVTIVMILLAFSAYTFLLNRYQQKEIKKTLKECTAGEKVDIKLKNNLNVWKFIASKLPASEAADLKKQFEQYLMTKYGHKRYNINNVNSIRELLSESVEESVKQKKYSKAINQLNLSYELQKAYYIKYYTVNNNIYSLGMILKHETSLAELDRLNQLQKQIFQKRLKFLKKSIYGYAELVSRDDSLKKFCSNYYARKEQKQSSFSEFDALYLSPLVVNKNLNICDSMLYALKCINYGVGYNDKDILKYRFSLYSLNFVINNLYHYYNLYKQQQSIAAVALARFKLKYGRDPKIINELVPEFLSSHELMLFYVPAYLRQRKPSKWMYLARMKPNSLKELNAFMVQYSRYRHR